MSSSNVYTDIAESILEHAGSIARLDSRAIGDAAYDATVAGHVHAMRLLAVEHVDPQPDRELVRKLKALAGDFPGVFVQLSDGAIQLVIDSLSRQHKFKLWTRKQMARNEEDEDDFLNR
jgi:hypothetical protein